MKKRVESVWAVVVASISVLLLASTTADAQVGFARKDIPGIPTPAGVVSADFNGDGHLDLAVTNRIDNTVSVLLGNGDGTFGGVRTFRAGAGPVAIAAADFNGDTHIDMVTANKGDDSISILLGRGDGTFQPRVDLTSTTGPVTILSADFNGDGVPDLATANQVAGRISIWLGSGNGTFAGRMDFPTGGGPVALAAADFNKDGKLDLIAANYEEWSVVLLQGDGAGGLGPATQILSRSFPVALALGDFDSDGKLDVVSAHASGFPASFVILKGNGDGTFGAPVVRGNVPTIPATILASDLDQDGHLDVVVVSAGIPCDQFDFVCDFPIDDYFYRPPDLAVFRGTGGGVFEALRTIDLGKWQPENMAVGDFNSDGRADLVLSESLKDSLLVFVQAPVLSTDPRMLMFSNFQAVGKTSAPLSVTLTSSGSFASVLGPVSLSSRAGPDFVVIADTCSGATLAVGETCTVSVAFTPFAIGARTATLTFPNDAADGPLTIPLHGVGVADAPQLFISPTLGLFPRVLLGMRDFQWASLTNIGGAELQISGLAFTGNHASDFAIDVVDTECAVGIKLAAGQTCAVAIQFQPSAAGERAAHLEVASNDANSPQQYALYGIGATLTIAPAAGTSLSSTIRAGQTSRFRLEFSGDGAVATVSLRCTHSIPMAICTAPGAVTLNSSGPLARDVEISTVATALVPPASPHVRVPRMNPVPLLLLVMPLALVLLWLHHCAALLDSGRRRTALAYGTLVLAGLLWAGCGSVSSPPDPPAPRAGTPAGTYSVTVNATAGSNTQSVTLTVTVQ
jgi:hypothetical protein